MLKGSVEVHVRLEIPDGLKRVIQEQDMAIARRIAERARSSTEFVDKTGALRASIDDLDDPDLGAIVRSDDPKAHLVEFGHELILHGRKRGRVKAHPFLREAADAIIGDVIDFYRDAIDTFLDQARPL